MTPTSRPIVPDLARLEEPETAAGKELRDLSMGLAVNGQKFDRLIRDAEKQAAERYRVALKRAATIIEVADNRAMAADGPVGHPRDNMTDGEWRDLYETVTLPAGSGDTTP